MAEGPATLPIGTRLGNLEIRGVLGSGSFANTYRAYDSNLDVVLALKEYYPRSLAMRESNLNVIAKPDGASGGFEWGMQRFAEEAKILARLKHPNIVRLFHVFQCFNTAYFTMELLDGSTLKESLQSHGVINEQNGLEAVFRPILDALQLTHSHSVIHRGIEPGNIILVFPAGTPTLIDFGAGMPIGQVDGFAAILTPGYAPFEQYANKAQGPWTDIYALAATVCEAMTGSLPPEAPERMIDDDFQPLVQRKLKGFDPTLLAAIDWGLAPLPKDRPQSIVEWRTRLFPVDTQASASSQKRQSRRAPDASKIFISYRRSDAHHVAGRIYDHLAKEFGDDQLFFDVDSIPYGVDFRGHIDGSMTETAVVLAIVGSDWVSKDWRGRRWFSWRRRGADFVQVEIEQALEMGVPVIPLLIDRTPMPSAALLPATMKDFAYLNASTVRGGRDFRADMSRVVEAIRKLRPEATPSPGAVDEAGQRIVPKA